MKKFYAIAGIIAGVLIILGGVFTGVGIVSGADRNFEIWNKIGVNIGIPDAKDLEYTKVDDFKAVDVEADIAAVDY